MSLKQLTIASTSYLHSMPLLAQQISSENFELNAVSVKNIDECTMRMVKGEFDIGEMSLATFLKVQEQGAKLKALPVFSRKIPQMYAFCAENSSIRSYKDLRGKKVAVFQYWVTASIWHRWLLQHHYGVDPKDIIWCPLRKDRMENMPYPPDYQVDWNYLNGTPEELLRSGEIDCFFYARKPDDFSGLRWVFPDPLKEAVSFVQDTGIAPITHVMAIKDELLQDYPELISDVMELFEKSKRIGLKEVGHFVSLYLPFADWHLKQTENIFGGVDWNENGWSANAPVLETFFKAACEQGFISDEIDLHDCFVPYDYEQCERGVLL